MSAGAAGFAEGWKPEALRSFEDSVVWAWAPVQEGGENVHLGGQEINWTLNKTINSLWGDWTRTSML